MKFPFLQKTHESKENLPDDGQFIRKVFQMEEKRKPSRYIKNHTKELNKIDNLPQDYTWGSLQKYLLSNNKDDLINAFKNNAAANINKYYGIQLVIWLFLNSNEHIINQKFLKNDCGKVIEKETPLNSTTLNKAYTQSFFDDNVKIKDDVLVNTYLLIKNRKSYKKKIDFNALLKKYYKGDNSDKLKVNNYDISFFESLAELREREKENTEKDLSRNFDLHIDGIVGFIMTHKGIPIYEFSLGTDNQGRMLIEQLQKKFYIPYNQDGTAPIDKNGEDIQADDPNRSKKIMRKLERGGNKIYGDKLCVEITRNYAQELGIKYYGIQSAENNEYTNPVIKSTPKISMEGAEKIYDLFAQENGFKFDELSGNYFKETQFPQQKNSDIQSLFSRLKKYFS